MYEDCLHNEVSEILQCILEQFIIYKSFFSFVSVKLLSKRAATINQIVLSVVNYQTNRKLFLFSQRKYYNIIL